MHETKTILVGGTHRDAVGKCEEIGVAPYARTTVILTNRSVAQAHGLRITPEDRVFWHEDTDPCLADTVRRSLLKTRGANRG